MKRLLKLGMALVMTLVLVLASTVSAGAAETAPVTLKLLMQYWNLDVEGDPVKQAIEETCNVKLDVELLPSTDYQTKLNLLMSSGAEYDLVKQKYADFAPLAVSGNFMDLTDIIDNYPNLRASEPEENWDMLRVDGRLYGIPLQRNPKATSRGIAYRSDVLEQLNLEVPQTLDEFTNVLRVIKAQTGMIPLSLTAGENNWQRDIITSAFGFVTTFNYFVDENNTVQHYINHPNFKAYIAYMRQLYQEGLLDNEFSANNTETIQQKWVSGNAAFIQFEWPYWQCLATFRDNLPDASFTYMAPLMDDAGNRVVGRNVGQGIDLCLLIPKSTTKLDEVLSFLDTLCQPENYDYVYNGTEGQEFTTVSDTEWQVNEAQYQANRMTSWWWRLPGCYELRQKTFVVGIMGEGADVSQTYLNINKPVAEYLIDNPLLGMPISTVESKNAVALKAIVDDFIIQAITSSEDLDTMYQQMLATWNSEGGSATMEDLNRIYADWK